MDFRIGFGYDVHRLEEGIPFWLGGIEIDHHKGSLGHSDADVLLHAICDAMLGAAALGDIGTHFPDTDNAWKGISSTILLQKTMELLASHGYEIGNIDSDAPVEVSRLRGATFLQGLGISLTHDRTDSRWMPTRGDMSSTGASEPKASTAPLSSRPRQA